MASVLAYAFIEMFVVAVIVAIDSEFRYGSFHDFYVDNQVFFAVAASALITTVVCLKML